MTHLHEEAAIAHEPRERVEVDRHRLLEEAQVERRAPRRPVLGRRHVLQALRRVDEAAVELCRTLSQCGTEEAKDDEVEGTHRRR